jgi:PKD repeat protein
MRKLYFLITCVFAAVFLGLTLDISLARVETGFGDIIGYVTDSSNSQPVPFAEITAQSTSWIPLGGVGLVPTAGSFSTTADEQGFYTLSIPAGTYDLAVGKTGYESKTVASIALVTSGQAKLDFALTPLVGPVAVLSVVPAVTPVGTSVTLDARGSYHPEGEIVSYEWDLDNDGEWDDALGPTSSCSYERPGTFRVGLRVTDRNELVDTDEQEVIVTPLNSIPELPWGSILASTTMILAIVSYLTIPRFRKHVRPS